ncbi:MAG: hypothetical protein JRM99_07680, partial [Nitrososphaerota archaeon]|nr:hypothetical protein [Nitrososphaerota archaeon]
RGGRMLWLDSKGWEIDQKYWPHANVIETRYRGNGLAVSRTAFVDPRLDVFASDFKVSADGAGAKDVRLLFYQNPELEETMWGNATFYDPARDSVVQYRRSTYFAFGAAERSASHQCGIGGWKDDARADCLDGRLENSDAALSRGRKGVNSALAYHLGQVSPGKQRELCYFAAAGGNLERAEVLLETAKSAGGRSMAATAVRHWRAQLKKGNRMSHGRYSPLVERSLLTLMLLCDRQTGGIIASPSTDPDYRYVWPRDAFYVALALDRSGYHDLAEKFYLWCRAAQDRSGVVRQRYYASPEQIGPAWGPAWGEELDETACVVWGMVEHLRLTHDRGFLSEVWPFIREAAWYLFDAVDPSGKVRPTMNLWEEKPSNHVYSAATVCAGLKAASEAARSLNFTAEAQKWARASERVKERILDAFWDEDLGHFVRSESPSDPQVDISSLAISFPFGILPDRDPRMLKNAKALTDAFRFRAGGAGRFTSDDNYGGNPWVISTCWLSIHHSNAGEAAPARALLSWSADHSTPLGMLPEQVDKAGGGVLSAVPLAWSHAMFVLASQALSRAK